MEDNFMSGRLKPVDLNKVPEKPSSPPPLPDEQQGEDPISAARNYKSKPEVKNSRELEKDAFKNTAISQHPVLRKLKEKLGINSLEIRTQKVYVDDDTIFEFGFTEYPDELNIWCASESRQILISGSEEAKAMKSFDILRLGVSLVAINGDPVYEIFGINPTEADNDRLYRNRFDMSMELRKKCAYVFYQQVMTELAPFVDVLEDFFIENIVNKHSVKSAGKLDKNKSLYICEVMGCTFKYEGPTRRNSDGTEKPYVCTVHGTNLKKLLSEEEMGDIPLA